MTKLELADLILHHVYEAKEQNRHSYYIVETLTDDLNEYNRGLSVTEEQVQNAVDYLYERDFLTGNLRLSISPKGEDLATSGFSVQEVARRAFQVSPTNTTNTTINGDVNQFAQGDNNTQIQNNHTKTADDLFEKLMELLEQHNAGKLADEAKAEKKSGGIRKALAFITKKIADSFSTKAGQELVPLVMPAIAEITKVLPPQ
ncbi:MAG: hypothetical protein ACFNXY_11755 [Corynebacterium matruchotii]|uniref:hypothetical protein n=1 Tax=Corynebacterium matruchotii TaxID=43768 RepID=UPI00361061DB